MKDRKRRIFVVLLFCIALSVSWCCGQAWAKAVPDGNVSKSSVSETGAAQNGLPEEADVESRGQETDGKDEGPGETDGKDEGPGGSDDKEEEPEGQHSLVKTERKEPTCAEEGNIGYWACTICEKIFLDEAGE